MKAYKFVYNNKEYKLSEENCSDILNDEEHPVTGIEKTKIIELLCQQEAHEFDIEYYDQPCQNCLAGVKEKSKYFKFLEYHFFIYTKKGKYVTSSISNEAEERTFNMLLKQGIVDNSYFVCVIACVECGDYSVEISQCEV
ncbi:MAG: DUF3785 domain-containing protein [Clostridiales bacterium GWB2_37_7]|nr:MAG: DUF3785 domain-containing protein [Clostridiales bacterium GWB2_37_7]